MSIMDTTNICNDTYRATPIASISTLASNTTEISQALQNALTEQLCRAAYPEFREIRCAIDNGIVTLLGTVQSFYYSQVAQEIVRRTAGVVQVINEIHVSRVR